MKYWFRFIICLLLMMTMLPISIQASEEDIDIRSEYAIVISMKDDRIMYEKNIHERMYPASMTKIMSVLVAVENIDNVKKTYVFESKVLKGLKEAQASVAGFKAKDKVTYEDLLYGIMLPSGADASRAIAFSLFGSEEKFVEKMNEKAAKLGMEGTHFVNTSGLHDDDHYSTVYDIALLLNYALKNDMFKKIFTTSSYTTSNGLVFKSTFSRQKELVDVNTSMIKGTKTGYTYPASLCLASYGGNDKESFIVVNAQTYSDASYPYHIEDSATLYSYFMKYKRNIFMKKGEVITTLKVENSKEIEFYEVIAEEDISALLKENKNLKVLWKGKESIQAPDYTNAFLGSVYVLDGKDVVYEKDYFLDYNISGKAKTTKGISFGEFLLINIVIYIIGILWNLFFHRKLKR